MPTMQRGSHLPASIGPTTWSAGPRRITGATAAPFCARPPTSCSSRHRVPARRRGRPDPPLCLVAQALVASAPHHRARVDGLLPRGPRDPPQARLDLSPPRVGGVQAPRMELGREHGVAHPLDAPRRPALIVVIVITITTTSSRLHCGARTAAVIIFQLLSSSLPVCLFSIFVATLYSRRLLYIVLIALACANSTQYPPSQKERVGNRKRRLGRLESGVSAGSSPASLSSPRAATTITSSGYDENGEDTNGYRRAARCRHPERHRSTVQARRAGRDSLHEGPVCAWKEDDSGGLSQLAFHPSAPHILFTASRRSDAVRAYDLRYVGTNSSQRSAAGMQARRVPTGRE
ncbi:hypothetical protein L7F22_064812 [Adiantum nelumboides]|nr:hypothetical protein [Adiantum nelumboides]